MGGTTERRTHHWVTFAVLAVAVGSFALMQSLTVPVLPRIATELDTDQSTVTWVLTAYLLSASVFTPILGRVGDAVGKKRMLVVSLLMLSLGSLVAALAPTIEVMVAARVVQGAGGGVFPLAFGIIRDEMPHRRLSSALSVISSLGAVGFGAGIVLAGPLVNGLGYAWLFWAPMIVTAVAALVAVLVVPESPVRTPGRVPVIPALLLSAWLVCLLLGVSQAPRWGWASPEVIGLLVAAAVLVVVWVRLELRVPVPLVDMRMMSRRAVWAPNLVALLVGVAMYASFGFLPQLLQTPTSSGYGLGASVEESGYLMLPMAIASFLMGLVIGPIARVIGPRTVVIVGSLTGAIGLVVIAVAHSTTGEVVVGITLTGLGIGIVFASLAGLVVAAVSPEQTGVASGMNANIRTIGGAVGSAVMSTIVTAHLTADDLPREAGYTTGFTVLAGVMVLCAVASALIPRLTGRRYEGELERAPLHVTPTSRTSVPA